MISFRKKNLTRTCTRLHPQVRPCGNLPVQIARPPRQFVGESRALVGKNWDAVAFKSREEVDDFEGTV